jgi:hypothetical protein
MHLRSNKGSGRFTTVHKVTASVKAQFKFADKSLAPPGRKQATATEDFDIHVSYL